MITLSSSADNEDRASGAAAGMLASSNVQLRQLLLVPLAIQSVHEPALRLSVKTFTVLAAGEGDVVFT